MKTKRKILQHEGSWVGLSMDQMLNVQGKGNTQESEKKGPNEPPPPPEID